MSNCSIQTGSFVIILCVLVYITYTTAVLHDVAEVIDISNLDLANFQYFKNLPSQNPQTAANANPFLEHFQKKKAVLDYFEHLFFGLSPFTKETEIAFDPHFGRAWRPYFEQKYGKKGEHLVAMLGQGYSLQELRRRGAIPKEFGSAYYPTR